MPEYIDLETGTVVTDRDLNPPAPPPAPPLFRPNAEKYAVVFPSPPPAFDPITHTAVKADPVMTIKGHWEQQWAIVALPAEQVAANRAAAQQRLIESITQQTQARLDSFAQTRGYDDIKSACTYVGCPVAKFATEGTYCLNKRAETWATLYAIMAAVEANTRPMPGGYADIEPELPVLAWPI